VGRGAGTAGQAVYPGLAGWRVLVP
jgi:hypothetical protein